MVARGMAAQKPAIKSQSEPSISNFAFVPSCAECSDNLRWDLQRKDASRLRCRLKKEERQRLDFHGLAGDVPGFLAFLTHRSGSACRAWRKEVAPDEVGIAQVLQSDFFSAMRKMGFTGNVLSLWKELSGGKESCWLGDVDTKLARGLDQLAAGLFKVYKSGARQAWEDVPRAWQTRMNFPEFAHWMQEQAISRSRGFAVSERCLFDALDLNGIGTVTLQEFKFLDHWAHKRLKKPLPEEVQQKPPQQERSVELPVTKPPKKNTIKGAHPREKKREEGGPGGAGRAWRVAMDVKGNGALTLFEFGSGCRAVGWPHDHTEMFKLMKAAGGVKLRALDPETAEALVRFKEEAEVKSRGPLQEFWAEFMDPGGTGAISRTEFLKDMAVTLGIPKESLARVFTTLDPTDTGWVSESELQYLQTFESCLDFAEKEAPSRESSKEQKIQLPAGVLGDFRLPWQAVGRKTLSAEELMVSPLGRQLWAPHRSSRSFQYRALENSHMLKHRWLCSSVEDRCLFKSHDSVQTMRSDHNRLFRKKRNDFIFRTSHEFYRKGWHKYLHPEDEEEEHPS
ncbi:unnamed protein product [Effrenium voratum]|nr:unnamed protein product [Effrenium voratum]